MGYVLNLQGQQHAAPAGEAGPQSVWSTASVGVICLESTISVSACVGLSTVSGIFCA